MNRIYWLALAAVFSAGYCFAENSYTVQVGAYTSSDYQVDPSLESLGVVRTEQVDNLVRVTVGNLVSYSDAEALLVRIQSAGYGDAFIKRLANNSVAVAASHNADSGANYNANSGARATSSGLAKAVDSAEARFNKTAHNKKSESHSHHHGQASHVHDSTTHTHNPLLDKLSAEERRMAVYLDGKLHLKRGDEFIPLE